MGRPPDAEVPAWAGTYWRAWHALRFDRQFGAFGGESPISFSALDAYARRYAIEGSRFETFHFLVGAMDDEYLEHVSRVQANKPKQREDP